MTTDLRALADVVRGISGAAVGDAQAASLLAALARVDPQLTPGDLLADPDPALLERLVDEVAIKETFFLRHAEELGVVDWELHAGRAAAQERPLRIWSAGCSTGEEAYSLALLAAERLGPDRPPVDVLGTDLSSPALARARRGLYDARAMHLVDGARRERWFVPDAALFQVGDGLRRRVRFARHNLVHDPFPPAGEPEFDLVVCRNVLIYFDRHTAAQVTAALRRAVEPDGRLLLGTIDRLGSTAEAPAAPAGRARGARRMSAVATAGAPGDAAHAAFEAGTRALRDGDAAEAVNALRRALYLDPRRAIVALQLARAHEALADVASARRTYEQTLHIVGDTPAAQPWVGDQVAASDIAAACRARLEVL